MSSPHALATVTAALKLLLNSVVDNEDKVTTMPPAKARVNNEEEQINIFLYGTYYNSAFSNLPMLGEIRNGESAHPPMALVLKYLITTYGANDDDINSQELMGAAMSVLHDHPVLARAVIDAVSPDSGLQNQIERVRITPDNLSLDDMSKLWTAFQNAEYQLSTGYEVSVLLIDSTRAAKTPLPVLKRGENDQGVSAQPDLIPPFPALSEIVLPHRQQPSALLGDVLTLKGHHLDGDTVVVQFRNPRLSAPIDVQAMEGSSANQIAVQLRDNLPNWVAGFYTLDATISKTGDQDRTTNTLPLPLAPRILSISPPSPITRDVEGNVTLTLVCSPEIRPDQRIALLIGDREIKSQPHPVRTDTVNFLIEDAPVGNRFIRLRIDGIDSHVVDHNVTPPEFDAGMEVTIT